MTNGFKTPEDYEGGVKAMLEDVENKRYPRLAPLGERGATSVKIGNSGGETNEAEMWKQFGFSATLAELFRMIRKPYGYMRDGNLKDDVDVAAVKSANALHDLIFNAPCLNRQERFDKEEAKARHQMGKIDDRLRDPELDVDKLRHEWSKANAFMLQARITEERDGLDAARHMWKEFEEMKAKRDDAELKASRLQPAEYHLFWCRVRQYQIMAEETYDLALGYPTHDFKDVKEKLARGENVHDLVQEMAWPWQESYRLVMSSMLDGEAHRMLMMSMNAQQLPQQQAMGYPMGMGGYYPPQYPGQHMPDGQDPEGEPDRRPALFGFFGGNKNGQQQQPQEPERNRPRRRRSRGRR